MSKLDDCIKRSIALVNSEIGSASFWFFLTDCIRDISLVHDIGVLTFSALENSRRVTYVVLESLHNFLRGKNLQLKATVEPRSDWNTKAVVKFWNRERSRQPKELETVRQTIRLEKRKRK